MLSVARLYIAPQNKTKKKAVENLAEAEPHILLVRPYSSDRLTRLADVRLHEVTQHKMTSPATVAVLKTVSIGRVCSAKKGLQRRPKDMPDNELAVAHVPAEHKWFCNAVA
jgi:hypothetical protein